MEVIGVEKKKEEREGPKLRERWRVSGLQSKKYGRRGRNKGKKREMAEARKEKEED